MKKTKNLLLTTILLFFIVGCEDKKSQKTEETYTNTTREIKIQEVQKTPEIPEILKESLDTLILSGIEEKSHTITISDKSISSNDILQPIILINLFSTWCSPCLGEISYLSDLQEKYKNNLFIIGILVNDEQNINNLQEFINKYNINYFISNSKQNDTISTKLAKALQLPKNFSLPLTIIYKDGNYYTHYEGGVPIEMITHDIQQAIKE